MYNAEDILRGLIPSKHHDVIEERLITSTVKDKTVSALVIDTEIRK